MTGVFTPSSSGYLETVEVGSGTITIPVVFTPQELGARSAVLSIVGDMDVTPKEIALTGEGESDHLHARAMERRMPTGSAWHHETMRAILRGLGVEMSRVRIDMRTRATIANMLFGLNLENWLEYLNIRPTGTTEEKQQAITRKLSDIGGLTAADLTRELQAAGFPLTVYQNKYKVTPDPMRLGEARAMLGVATLKTLLKYYFKDLRSLENYIPLYMLGAADTRLGGSRLGYQRESGAELIANSIDPQNDNPLWASLPDDPRRWHYGFVISGDTIYDIKTIDEERQTELRRLILEIKPLGMWAFLICDYE